MTAISNPYDALYTKLKNRLTVVHDNCEYTVGEYMLMKAGKNARNENMPVVARANESRAVSSIIDFVNEKLTAKNPPRKEKTMRRFPLRTSASTLLSAAAACALVVSCGVYALVGLSNTVPYTAEVDESDYYDTETQDAIISEDIYEIAEN